MDWTKSDLYNFTAEHPDCTISVWGGYIGKRNGFEPYGYSTVVNGKIYFFGLDGRSLDY